MDRRAVLAFLAAGGAATSLLAQVGRPQPRVAVLMDLARGDREGEARLAAFRNALKEPLRLDIRWGGGSAERMKADAAEVVAAAPDVIVSSGSPLLRDLDGMTRTIPIVFLQVPDPVGQGFVTSLSRPGGNKTGFSSWDQGLAEKWVELLKLAAPRLSTIAALHGGSLPDLDAIERRGTSLGARVVAREIHGADDIRRVLTELASVPDAGFIVAPSPFTLANRPVLLAIAREHRLPAIFPYRIFAEEGGLMSYGTDAPDLYRRAAAYVERILAGEKPGELPVQRPAKFLFVLNLATARSLGLDPPPPSSPAPTR